MRIAFIFAGLSIVLFSCMSSPAREEVVQRSDGEMLITQYCYTCHKPEGEKGRLAPPMAYVKDHYWENGITEKEFVAALKNFVDQPDKKKAKMRGAIGNFGLMPQQQFSADTLDQILKFIYNTDFYATK